MFFGIIKNDFCAGIILLDKAVAMKILVQKWGLPFDPKNGFTESAGYVPVLAYIFLRYAA